MASFPLPSQLQTQYFQILQSIKPSINTNDSTSDFVIRGKVFAAFASGLYGDQDKVNNDTYISSASPTGLVFHGQDLNLPQLPATQSISVGLELSGTNGTVVNPGDINLIYVPTGVTYTNTTGGTVALGVLTVSIIANSPGVIGNVSAPAAFSVISPPAGITTSANLTSDLADGSDAESTDSYRSRLLNRLQQPPAGGNANDYRNFAFAADPSVRTVVVNRFGRGLGTVDIYITTGTTDIDTAVTNGLSIVRVPAQSLLDTVEAYYLANAPLTDCPAVFGPTEIAYDMTINVDLASNILLTTVPSDPVNNPLNLTVSQLIKREVGRALYKVPVGGWRIPTFTSGFIVASYIEQSVALWLSAEIDQSTGLPIGFIPVLADLQVPLLNSPNTNQVIAADNIVAPGTISVVLGT